jgi:hypothetical protein
MAKVSLAERVQVDIAKLCQNDCVLKIPDRSIARPRERYSASVFECELAGSKPCSSDERLGEIGPRPLHSWPSSGRPPVSAKTSYLLQRRPTRRSSEVRAWPGNYD